MANSTENENYLAKGTNDSMDLVDLLENLNDEIKRLKEILYLYDENSLVMPDRINADCFDELLKIDISRPIGAIKETLDCNYRKLNNVSLWISPYFNNYCEISPMIDGIEPKGGLSLDYILEKYDIDHFRLYITGSTIYVIGILKGYPTEVRSRHYDGDDFYRFYYRYFYWGAYRVNWRIDRSTPAFNWYHRNRNRLLHSGFDNETILKVFAHPLLSQEETRKYILSKEQMQALVNSQFGEIIEIRTNAINFEPITIGSEEYYAHEVINNGWWDIVKKKDRSMWW